MNDENDESRNETYESYENDKNKTKSDGGEYSISNQTDIGSALTFANAGKLENYFGSSFWQKTSNKAFQTFAYNDCFLLVKISQILRPFAAEQCPKTLCHLQPHWLFGKGANIDFRITTTMIPIKKLV